MEVNELNEAHHSKLSLLWLLTISHCLGLVHALWVPSGK